MTAQDQLVEYLDQRLDDVDRQILQLYARVRIDRLLTPTFDEVGERLDVIPTRGPNKGKRVGLSGPQVYHRVKALIKMGLLNTGPKSNTRSISITDIGMELCGYEPSQYPVGVAPWEQPEGGAGD